MNRYYRLAEGSIHPPIASTSSVWAIEYSLAD
jgi:hypothetical protein